MIFKSLESLEEAPNFSTSHSWLHVGEVSGGHLPQAGYTRAPPLGYRMPPGPTCDYTALGADSSPQAEAGIPTGRKVQGPAGPHARGSQELGTKMAALVLLWGPHLCQPWGDREL